MSYDSYYTEEYSRWLERLNNCSYCFGEGVNRIWHSCDDDDYTDVKCLFCNGTGKYIKKEYEEDHDWYGY